MPTPIVAGQRRAVAPRPSTLPHDESGEELYDFGVPVVVQAPPPGQVTDFSVLQHLVTTTTNPLA
jgi:hypothetical protein